MKKILTFIVLLLFSLTEISAQTLFTYGNQEVSKQEFLRAFNKNSNGEAPTEQAYREYLDLYIRFKLKVQAAYDKKLDTLPAQRAELESFRNQVIESFLNDNSVVQPLVDEAFTRSQKDIHLAHIFIPLDPNNPADTARAYKRAADAYNELMRGSDFGNVARIYSADSSVQSRQGDIGWITVFTLPYALETLAYSTPEGKFSKPYRSKAGYHIFKNIEERKAAGKIRVAQILLLVPPGSGNDARNIVKQRADSIYTVLQKGASFDSLARKFSNDNLTYQYGGEMPPFGAGTYDPEFEKAAFALSKDGALSRPVLTSQGYHIIKRLGAIPVNSSKDSTEAMAVLRQQVMRDGRMRVAQQAMLEKIYQLTGFSRKDYDERKLLDYYRDHLEDFNPDFAAQMKEFKEGNLLFEMMQSTIWEKAANDTVGLKNYYDTHKDKYWWAPSADAIIFTCSDASTANAIRSAFSINTSGWRDLMRSYEDKAQADSGRYEIEQLPVNDTSLIKAGVITQPSMNSSDNTTSFVYIKKVYNERAPRDFEEAKGFVLNDYQAYLEEKWIEELKGRYPVRVNEEVFRSLVR